MGNLSERLKREQATVETMISMYCTARHGIDDCTECRELREYARERLYKCPFGDKKPVCEKCPVHCYKPEMREKIRQVMRYAGPRMLFRHPVMALTHLISRRRQPPPLPKKHE